MKPRLRTILSFLVYAGAFLIGILLVSLWFESAFFAPQDPDQKEYVSFEVEKGWPIRTVARRLEEQKLIKHWWVFEAITRFSKNPQIRNQLVLAGEYRLSASYTPRKIAEVLIVDREVVYHQVMIPEGSRVAELPALLEKSGLVKAEEVQRVFNDKKFIALLGRIPSDSLEGYVCPDTYSFTRPVSVEEMLTKMILEGDKKITEEMRKRATDLGLTFHQVLTLASIIEKESGKPEDRPLVSSAFHNRLKIGMPLQSDPTVIYGIAHFDGNLTKEHLITPGAYNTYLNTSLPPTPICNPSLSSITAALFPADTDYLYFVAKGDGSSAFSATYKEHQENVNRYQKKQAEQNVPAAQPLLPGGASAPPAPKPGR